MDSVHYIAAIALDQVEGALIGIHGLEASGAYRTHLEMTTAEIVTQAETIAKNIFNSKVSVGSIYLQIVGGAYDTPEMVVFATTFFKTLDQLHHANSADEGSIPLHRNYVLSASPSRTYYEVTQIPIPKFDTDGIEIVFVPNNDNVITTFFEV